MGLETTFCWCRDGRCHPFGTLCQLGQSQVCSVARVEPRYRDMPHVLMEVTWAKGPSRLVRLLFSEVPGLVPLGGTCGRGRPRGALLGLLAR